MKLNPEQTVGFCRGTHWAEFVSWPDKFDFHGVEGFDINCYFLLRKYKERNNNMSIFSKIECDGQYCKYAP